MLPRLWRTALRPGPALTAVLAACTAPPAGPTPSPAPDPDPAPLQLSVAAPRSIRDLVAEVEPPEARVTWDLEGAPSGVVGTVVPAHLLWPGDTWTAHATHPDWNPQEATVVVPEPPGGNLLVLLLDDIGIDKVGAYDRNPLGPPTPHLDALAARGVRFDRAYASPVCSPTRGALLTGRHARRTGLGWIADTGTRDFALGLAELTIPEAIAHGRGASWANSATGKWHVVGPRNPDYLSHPNDQGFDWYAGTPGNPPYSMNAGYYRWRKNVNGVLEDVEAYMTTETVDDALDRVAAMPEPWFLYVPFNAAHTPLNLPPPELTTLDVTENSPDNDKYDSIVEALDTEIGRLLDSMDPDVLARTTIIALGDNGTSSMGVDEPYDPDKQKHTVYEGGIHVPLIAAGPHVAEPGSTSDALVHVTDVFATAVELAGVPVSTQDDEEWLDLDEPVLIDGRSLLPLLADPAASGRALLYAEAFSPNGPGPYNIDRRVLRDDRYKLMRLGSEEHLYDLGDGSALGDGPDLLQAPLVDGAGAAYERLATELDRLEAALVYEGG